MSDTSQREALELLHDTYELEECSRCEVREEFGLVLGDSKCAIGVAVCSNCGYEGRVLTVDPAGVATAHPYSHMFDLAMRWVPDWHPGQEDVTGDWRCACGQQWKTTDAARIHVYLEHPDRDQLSHVEHDRYPWKNVGLGEEAVMPDE